MTIATWALLVVVVGVVVRQVVSLRSAKPPPSAQTLILLYAIRRRLDLALFKADLRSQTLRYRRQLRIDLSRDPKANRRDRDSGPHEGP